MKRLLKTLLGRRLSEGLTRVRVSRHMRRALTVIARDQPAFDAESAIACLWSPAMRHVRPCQHREELLLLAREIERRRPKVVLEIGTAAGGTLFLSACLADPGALIISVDLPFGPFGGGYPEWKLPLYRAFARAQQRIELIRGDSHDPDTVARLQALLGEHRIDYLLLDGDHSYEGVRRDFETCAALLADGALVALHDIVEDRSPVRSHYCSDLWRELSTRYEHQAFVRDPQQDKFGIGVLVFRRDAPA